MDRSCYLLSFQMVYKDGVVYEFMPKQLEGMDTTLAYNLFNCLTLCDLKIIDSGRAFNISPEDRADIKGILKTLKTKKSIMLLSIDLIIREPSDDETSFEIVNNILEKRWSAAFQFRNDYLQTNKLKYDTYFAYIFDGYLNIFECGSCKLYEIDRIPLSKSAHFMKLYSCLDAVWKKMIIVRAE